MTLEAWAERNPLIDHPFPRPPPLPVESTGDTTTTPQEAVMTTDFPTPELAERPEQHLAVVRETLPMDGIRDHYDRAFPLIFNSLGKAGVSPSGPAMAVTHGMPAETIDLSAAVPVTDPISADGDVTPGSSACRPGGHPAGPRELRPDRRRLRAPLRLGQRAGSDSHRPRLGAVPHRTDLGR